MDYEERQEQWERLRTEWFINGKVYPVNNRRIVYHHVAKGYANLEGLFTAVDLRQIADLMDKEHDIMMERIKSITK